MHTFNPCSRETGRHQPVLLSEFQVIWDPVSNKTKRQKQVPIKLEELKVF